MNFSIPFFNQGTKKNSYFFGLLLKEQEGVGLVMKQENNTIVLKSYEKFSYSNSWENLTQDIDDLLFKIEHSLGVELKKTIFFIFSHLLDEKSKEIKKPFILKIKEFVKNLDLEALGYIECYEAITQIYEEKNEMPLSSIVLELDKTQASMFVYKSGNIVYSKTFSRTDDLIEDFCQNIDPVKKNLMLPARINIYDSDDLADESTKFISHHWKSDYFAQIPRISIINEEEIFKSLVRLFDKQINKKNDELQNTVVNVDQPETVMGFAIGKDILEDETIEDKPELYIEEEQMISQKKPSFTLPKVSIKLPDFTKAFSVLFNKFRLIKTLNIPLYIPVVIGFLIIISTLFSIEYFFHKAKITIFYPYQKISQSLDINAKIDDATSDLSITIASVSAEVSDVKKTTGKREIGEKAKGEITLHSFEDKEKIFAKGTVLSTASLQYILDDDVKVASASLATDGSAKLPGKANGKVTAQNIGTEYNIEKGKRFSITDLAPSIYFGINEKSFSGGTKKEVNTVSKKDLEDLNTALLAKAKNSKELIRQSTAKERIINNLTSIILKNSKASREIGEEAKDVTLTSLALATYYTFDEEKMISLIQSNIKKDIKSGFVVKKDNIKYSLLSAKLIGDSSADMSVSIEIKAMKDISTNKILKEIKGRSTKSLEDIVKNKLEGQGFEIKVTHPIPIFSSFTPFFDKNITLTLGSL